MGATPSNARQSAIVAEIERWPGFKEMSCLTSSDVSGIAAAYRKATEDSEGDDLARADFERWLEMGDKPTTVEARLFEVFRVRQGEACISLHDFVVGLLNYCVDSKEHLSRLAFDVYDRHTSGTITEADLEGMLIDVWGPNWEEMELARSLLSERAGMDPMQPGEWEAFCRVYPNLLHPIYKQQRTLQDATLGKKRWAKVRERLKKHKAQTEAKNTRMMRDALTEEDKRKVMQTIRETEAEANVLSGAKSQRIEAAREARHAGKEGGDDGLPLLPGIVVKAGSAAGAAKTFSKSVEARDRLQASKRRSTAMGTDPTNWNENPLRKTNKPVGEEEVPKFSMNLRKVKGADLAEEGGDGDGFKGTSAITPGSNGKTRSPLGSPSHSTQRQGPSLADTGIFAGGTVGDHRGSVGGASRIGGGQMYAGKTLGSPSSARSSEASDPRSSSRVGRPSSGDLTMKRSSVATVPSKPSSPSSATTTNLAATTGSIRKPSMALSALTHRPSVAAKSGRHPSVAGGGGAGGAGAGAAKRSSVAAYRDTKKDLLSSRRVSQQGVGAARRKPSRAVVAAGS